MQRVLEIAQKCASSALELASTSGAERNAALEFMASALHDHKLAILNANEVDCARAIEKQTPEHMVDRLRLSASRLEGMADALRQVVNLPDPLGATDAGWTRPNGLRIEKRRIPLGVIGIIYEARPNVTSDAAGLCLKSGNAVLLKGGSEAISCNSAVIAALRDGLAQSALPPEALGFVDVTDREAVRFMLTLDELIDVIIPRGGEGLIRFVAENASMPVIKHYKGVCHMFVDATATPTMAQDLVLNAKCQRPSVCNALETLLIHRDYPSADAAALLRSLSDAGVTLHACPVTQELAAKNTIKNVVPATESDWPEEYLSYDLAVKVVSGLDEAIAHIQTHGSLHTESIVTNDHRNAETFLNRVNSSTVMVNASTRFADGGELGLGAEIGISTTKLHAFGPMGLNELTTTKFVVHGDGQIRT